MKLAANPKHFGKARYQRQHQNATESALWWAVSGRKLGPRFHRQKVIGEYIVDFWCPAFRLVVEIHSEDFPYLPEREANLRSLGVRQVLTFSNTMPVQQMVEDLRLALSGGKRAIGVICGRHPDSGLTNWGTCWTCYSEKYRGDRP